MIEYREIQPPFEVPADGPFNEAVDELLATTPQGRILPARIQPYTFQLPVCGATGVVRVLRTGHGLLRVIPQGEDITDMGKSKVLLNMNKPGEKRILLDAVPRRTDVRTINHLFIYRPNLFPGGRPGKRPNGQSGS